jgi:TolB-like protein/DNA-binding winged helix-turn-helix (wHTH) protein
MLSPTRDCVRFGPFELDQATWQLHKNGTRIKLPQQPLQLLAILLKRPGEAFTREQLRQGLWPSGVFVDFDQGLNKNILKLREALGDSADSPRYIETLPRIGYRFIGAVTDPPEVFDRAVDPTAVPAEMLPAGSTTQRRKWGRALLWSALLGCATAAVGFAVWLNRTRLQRTPIDSVAVLPLENLSGDPNQDYFADGMTNELVTMLAKDSTLRVVSRTSAMQYKGVHRQVGEIAVKLGVNGIVEGTVNRSGDKVHMTVQLIHAGSDTNLWAESYDRDAENSVSLPSEAARAIAARLKKVAAPAVPPRFISSEAHEAYLHGRYFFWAGTHTNAFHDQAMNKAGEYFKQAVALQPDYAEAWSGLSDFYQVSALHGDVPPAESQQRAEAAAIRALQLDGSLADAHNAMAANLLFFKWNGQGALAESARSLELDPNSDDHHFLRSKILTAMSRMEEALQEQKKAAELDDFARPYGLAYMLLNMRRYDAAVNEVRVRLETLPGDSRLHSVLAQAYWYQGMKKEAGEELEKEALLENDKSREAAIRHAFESDGYEGIIRLQLDDLNRRAATEYVAPFQFADHYAELRLKEPTLHFLDEAYKEHSPRLVYLQSYPAYDFLHSDQRYRTIVTKVGLPSSF